MYGYDHRSYLKSKLAHKVQRIIGRPSTKKYNRCVLINDMIYWPIYLYNMKTAEDLFVKYKSSLRGKTTQSNPHRVDIVKR